MRLPFNLHYRDPVKLASLTPKYIGGQCQLHSVSHEVYRGEIKEIILSPPTKEVVVVFNWLCTRGFAKRLFDPTLERWRKVPTSDPKHFHNLKFEYIWFYEQRCNQQIKMKGEGEGLRLFLPGHHSNIKLEDAE